MKRRLLVGGIALGVVIIIIAAVAVIVGLGRDQPTAQPDRADRPVREELLREAKPDPGCSRHPRPKPSGAGEVRLGVLRLRGHCLVPETVLVTGAEADGKLAELRGQRDVVAADRVEPAAPPPSPGEPHAAVDGQPEEQWGRDSLGGDALRDLWPADAPEIRVGVVDTGIDPKQAEFGDRVIKVKDTELGNDDYESHGTFAAGIIAAADDGTGITGLAPKAKLLDAQYWRSGEEVGEPGIHDEIIWSVDNGAKVINLSAGSSDSSLLRAAYAYAELSRVVLVPAVGNCGTADWRPWPHEWSDYDEDVCDREDAVAGQADQPTVLGVGALNRDGKRAGFSSENRTVMIMAPGDEILSTCVTRTAGPRALCTDRGTSFAAPFVTGGVAILLARHPDASPAEIRQALIAGADPIDVARGERNDEYGYGKLNIIAAAKFLDDHPPEPKTEDPAIAAAMITGTAGAGHETKLIMDSGTKIDVQGLGAEGAVPDLAFSADGAWFAASDGTTLTVVDAFTGRQQSTSCSCIGVAFNSKNQVLTLQGGGAIEIRRYDPMTADWLGTTYAPDIPSSQIGPARVVGAAGDVALVTISQGEYANRLLAVWPDSKTITLDEGGLAYDEVAASASGRYVVATSPQSCPRLIDLEQTRKTGTSWMKWLWPKDDIFCASAMLAHFDGDTDLRLGWLASNKNVRYACMKPDQDGTVSVTGRLPIGPFQPSAEPTDLPWEDLDCTAAGIWPLRNGEQIRLRGEPAAFRPDKYTILRLKPRGEGEQTLAEHAVAVAVRPR